MAEEHYGQALARCQKHVVALANECGQLREALEELVALETEYGPDAYRTRLWIEAMERARKALGGGDQK